MLKSLKIDRKLIMEEVNVIDLKEFISDCQNTNAIYDHL